jgi:Leucine-rich repeat (LRR) protein/GTPase SAR1 family protein
MTDKELLEIIEDAAIEEATRLDLSGNHIEELPAEIGRLTNLTMLHLAGNQLTTLPTEIGKLTNLTVLNLYSNQITTLPTEIGKLTNLTELYLDDNHLTMLPAETGKLTNLNKLSLSGNKLTMLPTEIGEFANLRQLDLSNNQLSSLPAEIGRLANLTVLYLGGNQLGSLPAEIRQLTNLTEFHLNSNQLTSIPKELGGLKNLNILNLGYNKLTRIPKELSQLKNLRDGLNLHGNQLTSIPKELGYLTNLETLLLAQNRLTSIPRELCQLKNLTDLSLHENQLTSIPKELGQLANLSKLWLDGNQLTTVPKELGQLTNLTVLTITRNQLTSVPVELGQLKNLENLDLEDNLLESPPPEVVKQGTKAILAYLRELEKCGKRQWVSKLLFVGEGGVGKTSLLRALRGEEFIEGMETTHGIGVDKLKLAHPKEKNITMDLNTWDFGGQQIYHATHQFFLTNRALFVLVWDARHGWEAGKLYQWLDRIQAKAPESPVIIAAAHNDERDADLPLEDLRKKYPQIKGHYKVSNKTGAGIAEFTEELAKEAAGLPLMGGGWPATWLDAANEIRDKKEHYISPKELYKLMSRHNVSVQIADVLAEWLHELGDILYFKEDEELNDLVVLNPQWVTEAISKVLESEEVIGKDGIFTQQHKDEVWSDIDENIQEHLLRLMERFDLSYRTLENREISLVVERLPLDPPDYEQKWSGIKDKKGCKEISMKFELSSVPAGIPTWFIARSHRFTTHTHWRMGALFTDSKEERHLGLVEAYPHERYLRLTVRGPVPNNFFVLLRDGLELTLARFPGLKIKRTMPCPGHNEKECKHEFDFGQLEKAVERDKPALEIQCPETFENVSVPGLLFGLHWSTENNVIARIDELEGSFVAGKVEILTELRELRELSQREFLRLFNAQQGLAESHCPNVFAVLPEDEESWLAKNILGQKMVLQLFCQAPGYWHPTIKGGRYEIKRPAEFFKEMGPYILKLAKVIKYAAPVAGAAAGAFAGPVGAAMGVGFATKLTNQIKLMEELAMKLSERDYLGAELLERAGGGAKARLIEGAELRALRKLLDEEDKKQEWGGLKKVLTPEGHYLWLCEKHAAEYKK